MQEYLEVGQIVNTNGLKGLLKINPFTDDITRFERLKTILVEHKKELLEFEIESVRYQKKQVLLKLKEQGTSIIIISHNLDYLAEYADRIIVMNNGKIVLDDLPNIVFGKQQMLDELNIGTCSSKNIINLLKANDIQMPDNIIKYNDLLNSLITCFGE